MLVKTWALGLDFLGLACTPATWAIMSLFAHYKNENNINTGI